MEVTAPVRVCFVCLGNICRSPTAEGVLRQLVREAGLEHAVVVDSAGTAAYHVGELPDPRTRAAARARGIELTHRAWQFGAEDFARFDWVLAADAANHAELARRAPDAAARAKLHHARDFEPGAAPGSALPDPYYGGREGFEQVLDLCFAACAGLLTELVRRHQLEPRGRVDARP